MKKINPSILLISLLEGGSLMGVEFTSVKLITPYFGTSMYVWAAVFSMTFIGIALGYYIGAFLSQNNRYIKKIRLAAICSVIYTLLTPIIGYHIMDFTINLNLIIGVLLSSFFIIIPTMVSLTIISPLLIQYINFSTYKEGMSTGLIYSVSTLGGVFCTFLFGYYLIPFAGVNMSFIIVAFMMLVSFFLTYLIKN